MPIPPEWDVTGNPYLERCPVCDGAGFTDEDPDTCSTCRGIGATGTPEGVALAQALSIFYGYGTALATVDHAGDETEAEALAEAERASEAFDRKGRRGRKRTAKETDRAPAPTRRRGAQGKRRRA